MMCTVENCVGGIGRKLVNFILMWVSKGLDLRGDEGLHANKASWPVATCLGCKLRSRTRPCL